MWNKSISLPVERHGQQDSAGFEQVGYDYITGIPASFKDVGREEEILAAQKGYTADHNIDIMACNYNGASFLLDESDGCRYDIHRTFRKDKGMLITLTCGRRECDGI